MKRICRVFPFIITIILLPLSAAYAGEQYNRYNQDLHKLAAEQWKDPSKIIKFSDEAGSLARAVMNFDRVMGVLREIEAEIGQQDTLAAFAKNLEPTLSEYETAFKQFGIQYEAEYLTAIKINYTVLNELNRINKKVTLSKNSDPNVIKLNKLEVRTVLGSNLVCWHYRSFVQRDAF